jgi:thiamine biosynthesis lipoprotein
MSHADIISRARIQVAVGLGVALLASACSKTSRLAEYELGGRTMGTTFSVKLVAPTDTPSRDDLSQQIHATLERVENLTSTYLVHSELSNLNSNRSTEWIEVTPELCGVIEQAVEVSRRTDGAFDITVGPLVNLWGFGPDGVVLEPPAPSDVSAAMSRVGYSHLHTDCSVPAVRKDIRDLYLDLSGWAKGFAVDEVATLLDGHALENYLVEIGGELRARGHNADEFKWSIAIEKPAFDERAPQTILRLTDCSVATSGDYRNYFAYEGIRYSHTIDARSGKPVSHALAAVTVIDDSAAFADAMATALLVLGPEAGPALAEQLELAAYFLVRGENGIEQVTTEGFLAMDLL